MFSFSLVHHPITSAQSRALSGNEAGQWLVRDEAAILTRRSNTDLKYEIDGTSTFASMSYPVPLAPTPSGQLLPYRCEGIQTLITEANYQNILEKTAPASITEPNQSIDALYHCVQYNILVQYVHVVDA